MDGRNLNGDPSFPVLSHAIPPANLQRAGFVEIPSRGKGSHSFWKHLTYSEIPVITLSGQLGDDAKAYQERTVRNALAQVKGRERDNGYER